MSQEPQNPDSFDHPDLQEHLVVRERPRTRKPRRYKVLLHNDDYTSMEFVVHVLIRYFHKDEFEANRIMLDVHQLGKGVAGIYTYDQAETKVAQVTQEAREAGMPLQLSLEAE